MNSTGRVTTWKKAATAKSTTPTANRGLEYRTKPRIMSRMEIWELKLHTGMMAPLSLIGPYSWAYWTAWPASWAATPTEAMLVEPYTASDRRMVLVRGS